MVIIWCIPGIFGFLAWELRENWRLYAANRANRLRRVIVGSHGESMMRLLRPGFHSGTIPKRFAKLRRAERKARENGGWKAARKHLEVLHHTERDVRRFVEREFLARFADWLGTLPAVEKVYLSTNRVRAALSCPAVADATLWLAFEMQSGWLLAGARERKGAGASPQAVLAASPHTGSEPVSVPSQTLSNALLGLYKTAAVELIRQQVEAQLPAPVVSYHCDNPGLVLWPDDSLEIEVHYDLRHDGSLAAPVVNVCGETGRSPTTVKAAAEDKKLAAAGPAAVRSVVAPMFDRTRLVFRETVILWEDWVAAWSFAPAEGDEPALAVVPVHVLPTDCGD